MIEFKRFARGAASTIGLAVVLFSLIATPGLAAPQFSVTLSHEKEVISRSDERMEYTVQVKNDTSLTMTASVGDTLTCDANSDGQGEYWYSAEPTFVQPTFTFKWLSNGVEASGPVGQPTSTTGTYVVQAGDEGHALQCLVKGSNAGGAHLSFAEPIVVSPAPQLPPPGAAPTFNPEGEGVSGRPTLSSSSGSEDGSKRTCIPPTAGWTGSATATTVAGSNVLTNVVTGGSQPFVVGQTVVGEGIPPGATITAIDGQTLKLSADASASASDVGLEAVIIATASVQNGSKVLTEVVTARGTGILASGSKLVTGVNATAGAFVVGQSIEGTGIPAGTTITAVEPGTLELSAGATSSDRHQLSAGAQPFAVGQAISGPGLPAGTTIDAVSGRTLTLSANVTFGGGSLELQGAAVGSPIWSFQWLRNGEPIPGATSSTYQPKAGAGEEDEKVVLQCEVIGRTGSGQAPSGGTVVAISTDETTANRLTEFSEFPPNNNPGKIGNRQLPLIPSPNETSGTVNLELELPAGQETFAYRIANATGWDCTLRPASGAQHASIFCTRSNVLAPSASYPPVKVLVHPGADAPDLAAARATVSGGGATTPGIADDAFTFAPAIPWGIEAFKIKVGADADEETDYTRAGGHPVTAGASFFLAKHRSINQANEGGLSDYAPVEHLKNTFIDAARGFVGNALTVATPCPTIAEVASQTCPPESAVGGIVLVLSGIEVPVKIYSITPEFGTPAQFAFDASGGIYTFVPRLRPDEGYAISFEAAPAPEAALILGAEPTLCGFGLKEISGTSVICYEPGEPGANPTPLITNPTRCSGPPPAQVLRLDSWEHPGDFKTNQFSTPQITDCDAVKFEPEVKLTPTNREADSPTGLDVEFTMPTEGLFEDEGVAQATLDNAVVTFPKGMTVNPASADGLGACSLAQLKFHSNAPDECPESSRVGTVEIETPLIHETLHGSVYLAKQNDNPFQSAFGLYLVFSSPRDGVTVKVAGKLVPDSMTGQLVSTFSENPEWPFSRLALHFASGPRAPLVNPPTCGTYAIHSELSPWSAVNPANPTPEEVVAQDSTYKVNRGPRGGACPSGNLEPKLSAGVRNTQAGSKSPFTLSLHREDGSQRFVGLDVENPEGLTAYLKGIPYCSESVLAGISGAEETGRIQVTHPSCPAASQVGDASAGSGAGPFPFHVDTGKVYLAGPYRGAPVSLAVVTPAVAGPFDLGNVVTRVALYIDPTSAQVTARSDPIPTALHGIVLDVRDIRVALDRPNFTAAPTNCELSSVQATVAGEQGARAQVANRFQVGGCEALAFKPFLSFRLFGGTHRGSHPKLRAVLKMPEGDANVAAASVALPHSEFLDQAHIETVCTRVQFASQACPPGSIYGEAEATTPLLDKPLKGPVYLRSSDNQLPDLVAALRGPDSQPIEVDLDGRIDSVNGGIRSTFQVVPDQPVSSFTLRMKGGKKGLLVNSRDVCASTSRATALFTGQNGKKAILRPRIQSACARQSEKKHHKRHGDR